MSTMTIFFIFMIPNLLIRMQKFLRCDQLIVPKRGIKIHAEGVVNLLDNRPYWNVGYVFLVSNRVQVSIEDIQLIVTKLYINFLLFFD